MIYLLSAIWIYFTFWLFTWYTHKLTKDVSGIDQYWHIPQMIFLIAIYLLPFVMTLQWEKLLFCFVMGLQFPFIFNSGLNAYRRLPITHLGRYDFLSFKWTVGLSIIGLVSLIIFIIVKGI